MLKIRTVFFVLLLISTLPAFGQDTLKMWDPNSHLQWTDFKGAVDEAQHFIASTNSGTAYSWKAHVANGKVTCTFTTHSFMNRYKSWARTGGEKPAILKHERLHFDISEFFARKLLEALNSYTYTNDFRNEFVEISNQMAVARMAMQDKYDEETAHGDDNGMQAQWEQYVADLLANNYSYEDALKKEPVAR